MEGQSFVRKDAGKRLVQGRGRTKTREPLVRVWPLTRGICRLNPSSGSGRRPPSALGHYMVDTYYCPLPRCGGQSRRQLPVFQNSASKTGQFRKTTDLPSQASGKKCLLRYQLASGDFVRTSSEATCTLQSINRKLPP